jgi:hypothetical protein
MTKEAGFLEETRLLIPPNFPFTQTWGKIPGGDFDFPAEELRVRRRKLPFLLAPRTHRRPQLFQQRVIKRKSA